jgi:hypothetical protein
VVLLNLPPFVRVRVVRGFVNVTLPNSNGTVGYTLTASKSGCSNQTANTSVSVSGCSGGGSCNYTEGQFMTEWLGNEIIRAYICGTKFYAKNDAGNFKSKSWLTGTGRFTQTELDCFEENDPRPAGCGSGGCTPPSPPSISTNSSISPATLTATGCGGSITWSNGQTANPLNNVGAGTYTATCTVSNCTSGVSNTVTIGGGGGCPTYSNPQWFHWDNASSSLWWAHYGPTGVLYAATDANPATPALTRQQLLNSGVASTLAACFADGAKQRIAAIEEEMDDKIMVYPNPTTGKVKLVFSLQKAENVWLNLYDTQGKSLDLRDFEGKTGRNEMEYDLQNYPSGAYFVNFQSSDKREILKVMKVN